MASPKVGPATITLLLGWTGLVAPAAPQQDPGQSRPVLSLEGESAPWFVCVQAFLAEAEIHEHLSEKKTLEQETGIAEREWGRLLAARSRTKAQYRGIDRRFDEELEHLAETALSAEDWDPIARIMRSEMLRERGDVLLENLRSFVAFLGPDERTALRAYLRPGRCGGFEVSYNTTGDSFDPEVLAFFEEFETQMENELWQE